MAEQEPNVADLPLDVRGGVDKLQQKAEKAQKEYEKAQSDLARRAAFGAFDTSVSNEGEVNYQEYIEARPEAPLAGVVRNGSTLQNAETGKFASSSEYEAQNGTAQDYYDAKVGIENSGSNEAPHYAKMGVPELLAERQKARELGDTATERIISHEYLYDQMGVVQLAKEAAYARKANDGQEGGKEESAIREALIAHLTIDAMKDDSETPEEAQQRYDQELARYESLIETIMARAGADTSKAHQLHDTPSGEGQPSARSSEKASKAAEAEDTRSTEQENYAAGEKVTVANTFVDGEGNKVFEVIAADGSKKLIPESELSTQDTKDTSTERRGKVQEGAEQKVEASQETEVQAEEPAKNEKSEEASPGGYYNGKKVRVARYEADENDSTKDSVVLVDEDGNTYSALASEITYTGGAKDEYVSDSKEVELYKPTSRELLPVETQEAKKWWHSVRDGYYKLAGAAFWAGEWARDKYSKWLEYGVDTDTMTVEQQERRRKDNRHVAILVGAGVAIVGGLLAAKGLGAFDFDGTDPTAGFNGRGPLLDPDAQEGQKQFPDNARELFTKSQEDEGVKVVGFADGEASGPEVIETAPSGEVIAAASGQGGIELFESIGLNSDVWYANARTLLSQFPNDFYLEAGDVRIAHNGPLSQPAQNYINSLR